MSFLLTLYPRYNAVTFQWPATILAEAIIEFHASLWFYFIIILLPTIGFFFWWVLRDWR